METPQLNLHNQKLLTIMYSYDIITSKLGEGVFQKKILGKRLKL